MNKIARSIGRCCVIGPDRVHFDLLIPCLFSCIEPLRYVWNIKACQRNMFTPQLQANV